MKCKSRRITSLEPELFRWVEDAPALARKGREQHLFYLADTVLSCDMVISGVVFRQNLLFESIKERQHLLFVAN